MATNQKKSNMTAGSVKTNGTTAEMMERFETIKTKKENATDVRVLLPSRAHVENNNLVVRDIADSDSEYASLTRNRKNILKEVNEHPTHTQDEIAALARTSGTSVSRTLTNFGFVLKDRRLFKYFVLGQRYVFSEEEEEVEEETATWEVEYSYPNGEEVETYEDEEEARRAVFHHANVFEEYPVLRNPDGEVIEPRGVLDLIVERDGWTEEAIDGVREVEESHDGVVEFFEDVNNGGLESDEGSQVFDDDELFTIFKVLALKESEECDSLAKKVAEYI